MVIHSVPVNGNRWYLLPSHTAAFCRNDIIGLDLGKRPSVFSIPVENLTFSFLDYWLIVPDILNPNPTVGTV